jgi:PAS domain S-box-containing protein
MGISQQHSEPQLSIAGSAIQRYGLAVVSVSLALGAALLLDHYSFRYVADPLFLFAIAISAWYAEVGAALLALILSSLAVTYFFIPPIYSFAISRDDVPHFILFLLFASLLTWFSIVRRRVEEDLRQARDTLETEVAERTQQASLLNLTHDTIFVRDMTGVVQYWNRGAQELYGWTAEEAIGKRSHELLRTVYPYPVEQIRAELLASGRWEGELEKARADGTPVVVASRWSLQRDGNGQPLVVLETNNDITENKRREQEIRTLNEELGKRSTELEGTNKELEAFAYSISHDLRAPLRHMFGFAELLQKSAASSLNEKSRRYLTMILDSAKRMGTLIDDLLGFSRISRAEAHKALVSLEQLVQEALGEVRQETEGRNIAWTVGPLPAWHCDRSMLRLVFVNLIANAVKFTGTRAQAEIEIGCLEPSKEQGTDQVVVFVRDNGVGFDMKYVNKLFGVFQRLHSTEAFEGTGIGLATVQRIVHRHGGRVWAEGQVDRGATFYFSISKSQGV